MVKNLLRKPNWESGSILLSLKMGSRRFKSFSNSLEKLCKRLIDFYEEGQSGDLFGFSITMIMEYFHNMGSTISSIVNVHCILN